MGYDPRQLMELARLGAIAQLDVIRQHFPDLIASPKRPYRKKENADGPGPQEVPVVAVKNDINPKTGEPYKMSPEQRALLSKKRKAFLYSPRGRKERYRLVKYLRSQKRRTG